MTKPILYKVKFFYRIRLFLFSIKTILAVVSVHSTSAQNIILESPFCSNNNLTEVFVGISNKFSVLYSDKKISPKGEFINIDSRLFKIISLDNNNYELYPFVCDTTIELFYVEHVSKKKYTFRLLVRKYPFKIWFTTNWNPPSKSSSSFYERIKHIDGLFILEPLDACYSCSKCFVLRKYTLAIRRKNKIIFNVSWKAGSENKNFLMQLEKLKKNFSPNDTLVALDIEIITNQSYTYFYANRDLIYYP